MATNLRMRAGILSVTPKAWDRLFFRYRSGAGFRDFAPPSRRAFFRRRRAEIGHAQFGLRLAAFLQSLACFVPAELGLRLEHDSSEAIRAIRYCRHAPFPYDRRQAALLCTLADFASARHITEAKPEPLRGRGEERQDESEENYAWHPLVELADPGDS